MVSLDGGFLEGAVHAFDLTVRPWMIDLGHAVLDTMFTAAQVEHVSDISGRRAVAVTWRMTELGAVIGQDRVYLVRGSLDYTA